MRNLLRLSSVILCAALAAPASAYDVEIDSETIGQGYQLVDGTGAIVSRRRLDQYLGLSVWNLGPKDKNGAPEPRNQWYFTSSLRMQFDFGSYPPPGNNWGGRDVSQEFANNRLEILYAFLGAKDVAGFLDLRLGRQIDYDNFEFVSYDGLNVVAKTPWYLAAEAYAGLLVNGYLAVDSPIFRPDGTAPGALSIHDGDAKPVIGVALRSFGFRDLDARLTFREVLSPGSGTCGAGNDIANLERCAHVKDGTTEQKIGWSGRGRLFGGALVPWLGLRYDLLSSVLDTVQAGVRYAIDQNHSLQVEYLYSYPTFDGDSIFNLFARSRFDDVRLGYDLRAGRVRAYGRGFLRFFHDIAESTDRAGATGAPRAPGSNLDGGGTLGSRVDFGPGFVRADAYLETGYGGQRIGGDVSTRWKVYREMASVEGRLLYSHFTITPYPAQTAVAPTADSFGFQVGGRVAIYRGILLHVILEDNINKFYTSQLRLYAVLDITALLGSNGFSLGAPRGIGPTAGQFGSPYGTGMGY